MGRKLTTDGRRNNVSAKLSDAELAAFNAARGTVPAGQYARSAILAALPDSPAERAPEAVIAPRARRARQPKRDTGIPDAGTEQDSGIPRPPDQDSGIPADCPHPKGRRLKNGTYCGACGQVVS